MEIKTETIKASTPRGPVCCTKNTKSKANKNSQPWHLMTIVMLILTTSSESDSHGERSHRCLPVLGLEPTEPQKSDFTPRPCPPAPSLCMPPTNNPIWGPNWAWREWKQNDPSTHVDKCQPPWQIRSHSYKHKQRQRWLVSARVLFGPSHLQHLRAVALTLICSDSSSW